MKTFITSFILLLALNSWAAPIVKNRIGEDLLRQRIAEAFPGASIIEVLNFYAKGSIPESAKIMGLHPEVPVGQVQIEYIWTDKGLTKQAFAQAVVKVYSKVVVARSDIANNEPFTDTNTRQEEREISPLRVSGYFASCKDLSEFRSRGFISRGTLIGELQIAKPVLVQAGQMIDLVYSKSHVRITAKVKALERGTSNQWIRMENPTTKRVLHGRVTEFGQASIQ